MHLVMVNVFVSSPSPLVSLAARKRRSARSRRGQTREVGDDRWGHFVSDREFKMDFFLFSEMDE